MVKNRLKIEDREIFGKVYRFRNYYEGLTVIWFVSISSNLLNYCSHSSNGWEIKHIEDKEYE